MELNWKIILSGLHFTYCYVYSARFWPQKHEIFTFAHFTYYMICHNGNTQIQIEVSRFDRDVKYR